MEDFDIAIIGAGFGGMYAVHRLRKHHSVVCFEAGSGVGGTWYWNRYPGARVDVKSVEYSYGFDDGLQQDWSWSEQFAAQPELERYANHVADRFNLREHIRLSNRVTSVIYDEGEGRWHVRSENGDHIRCKYVVAATGALNAPYTPDWPDRDKFEGTILHSTQWPRGGFDLSGKRVGLIGTGSTGIQIAPIAAETAKHLYVFQRTPAYSMPSGNAPMDPEFEKAWKNNYSQRRKQMLDSWGASLVEPTSPVSIHNVSCEDREALLEKAWNSRSSFQMQLSFPDVMVDPKANEYVAEFVRNKIRQTVKDPEVAEALCPKDYPLGAKRLCIDNGYFQTFNRENVTLVDVKRAPIRSFTPSGLRTDERTYDLDVIIVATGFHAVTGALLRMDVKGVGGLPLAEKWQEGPTAYLGMMIAGYPNFFMVHGPLSPSVQAQMITTAEWQVNWIASRIEDLENDGLSRIEATAEAEVEWAHVVEQTTYETVHRLADSWYIARNKEGRKSRFSVYVGGFPRFAAHCEDAVRDNYRGFVRC